LIVRLEKIFLLWSSTFLDNKIYFIDILLSKKYYIRIVKYLITENLII